MEKRYHGSTDIVMEVQDICCACIVEAINVSCAPGWLERLKEADDKVLYKNRILDNVAKDENSPGSDTFGLDIQAAIKVLCFRREVIKEVFENPLFDYKSLILDANYGSDNYFEVCKKALDYRNRLFHNKAKAAGNLHVIIGTYQTVMYPLADCVNRKTGATYWEEMEQYLSSVGFYGSMQKQQPPPRAGMVAVNADSALQGGDRTPPQYAGDNDRTIVYTKAPGAPAMPAGVPGGEATPASIPINEAAPAGAPGGEAAPASIPINEAAPARAPGGETTPASAPINKAAPAGVPEGGGSTPLPPQKKKPLFERKQIGIVAVAASAALICIIAAGIRASRKSTPDGGGESVQTPSQIQTQAGAAPTAAPAFVRPSMPDNLTKEHKRAGAEALADLLEYSVANDDYEAYVALYGDAGLQGLKESFETYKSLLGEVVSNPDYRRDVLIFSEDDAHAYTFIRWLSHVVTREGSATNAKTSNYHVSYTFRVEDGSAKIAVDEKAQQFYYNEVAIRLIPEQYASYPEGSYYVNGDVMVVFPLPLEESFDCYLKSLFPAEDGGFDAELLITNGKKSAPYRIRLNLEIYDAHNRLFYRVEDMNLDDLSVPPNDYAYYKFHIAPGELLVIPNLSSVRFKRDTSTKDITFSLN